VRDLRRAHRYLPLNLDTSRIRSQARALASRAQYRSPTDESPGSPRTNAKVERTVTGLALVDSDLTQQKAVFDFVQSRFNEFDQSVKRWNNLVSGKRHSIAELYAVGRLSLFFNLELSISPVSLVSDLSGNDQPRSDSMLFSCLVFEKNTVDDLNSALAIKSRCLSSMSSS
jgi:hypothetical protein